MAKVSGHLLVYLGHLLVNLVEISKKNNKGVLGRPWTKWRVLRAISSTLKFQSAGKY